MAKPNPFAGVGKEPGVKIWRIQAFELVEQPKHLQGSFYSGDCYLILETFLTESKSLKHNVHFWIGSECSQDEQGSAAVFAVQLDDALGGAPVQFRQQQGQETKEFLTLFPRIRYLQGGHASGFKSAGGHRDPKRLYQIKSPNKNAVQIFEVPCAVSSLNSGDCYVAEDPSARLLWVWHGAGANIREKLRAVEAANFFKDGTGIKMQVLDEGDTTSTEAKQFFAVLGVADSAAAPPTIAAANTDTTSQAVLEPPSLYQVKGASEFVEVAGPGSKLSRAHLASDQVYVLSAAGCVWVWVGHESTGCDLGAACKVGSTFASSHGLPASTPIKVVKGRFEPNLFTGYFPDWLSMAPDATVAAAPARNSFGLATPPAKTEAPPPVDLDAVVKQMLDAPAASAPSQESSSNTALDAVMAAADKLTSSKVTVRVMVGSNADEIPGPELGQFYDGEAYIVVHAFSTGADTNDKRHVVYTWIGRHASSNEKGTAAVTAADMHHKLYAGTSTLVRVTQGNEPAHFVRLFAGKFIVRRGNCVKGNNPGRSTAGVHLYQVKSESVSLARPVEVEATAAALCSNDCFVVERAWSEPRKVIVWQGRCSSAPEQEAAQAAASILAAGSEVTVTTVQEGSEGDDFWSLLGGKAPYASNSPSKKASRGAPVLFHLRDTSAAAGSIKVEAYSVFSQEQLEAANTDVVLLDTRSEVYLWVGKECRPTERSRAKDIGTKYLQALGRGDEEVVEVEAGKEPHFFTALFSGFDERLSAPVVDVYADKLAAMQVAGEGEGKGEAEDSKESPAENGDN